MDIKSSSESSTIQSTSSSQTLKEQAQRMQRETPVKPAAPKKIRKYATQEQRDEAHRQQANRHIKKKRAIEREAKLAVKQAEDAAREEAKKSTICRVRAILYACNHSKIASIVHKNCPSVGPDVITGTVSCRSATTLPHISDTRCPRCVYMSEKQGRTWQEATDYIVKRYPRCFLHELDIGEVVPVSFREDFWERIVAFMTKKGLGYGNEPSVLDQSMGM